MDNSLEMLIIASSNDQKKPDFYNTALVAGGDEGDRTPDLSLAKAALSHLSYIPTSSDSYSEFHSNCQPKSRPMRSTSSQVLDRRSRYWILLTFLSMDPLCIGR